MNEWEWDPLCLVEKNIYTSKCTPHFIPVASLDWKSNWLAKTIHVMNYKDIGVFYWTQELGGTWISGKSYALELERQKNSLSLSPLNSSCVCFTLSLQIDFLSSSRPLVKYGHPEFASYSSNQTDRVAWPSLLQFQIPGRKDLIGSALLMIPVLVQWAMTRGHALQ